MPTTDTPGRSTAFGHLQDDLHLSDRALDQVRWNLDHDHVDEAQASLETAKGHWNEAVHAASQVTPAERPEADDALAASLRQIEAWGDKVGTQP